MLNSAEKILALPSLFLGNWKTISNYSRNSFNVLQCYTVCTLEEQNKWPFDELERLRTGPRGQEVPEVKSLQRFYKD